MLPTTGSITTASGEIHEAFIRQTTASVSTLFAQGTRKQTKLIRLCERSET
jgi:hypothetical protein